MPYLRSAMVMAAAAAMLAGPAEAQRSALRVACPVEIDLRLVDAELGVAKSSVAGYEDEDLLGVTATWEAHSEQYVSAVLWDYSIEYRFNQAEIAEDIDNSREQIGYYRRVIPDYREQLGRPEPRPGYHESVESNLRSSLEFLEDYESRIELIETWLEPQSVMVEGVQIDMSSVDDGNPEAGYKGLVVYHFGLAHPSWERAWRTDCDYLVVGEDEDDAWVVAMELKSGRFKATDAARQLQGGADMIDSWLPWKSSFRFVPVLAHGRTVAREEQKALRRPSNRVSLRGQVKQIELIRCEAPLAAVLDASA